MAAQGYYNAVNTTLYLDQLAAVSSWTERRQRILKWMAVVDSGDDLDRAAEAIMKVSDVVGDGRECTTTLFDAMDEIAALEGRLHADRANLQRAVVFYLAAVDGALRQFTEFVECRGDLSEQQHFAEDTIRMIEHYTMRIGDIQQLCPSGSGKRPLV
jgi:hypothetical protein